MNFRELLQNKNVLIGIGVVLIVVIVVGISIAFARSGGDSSSKVDPDDKKKIDGKVELVTSENLGKIIEI